MKYFCPFFQLIIYINISKIQLLIISFSSINKGTTMDNNKRNLQTKNIIDNIIVINNISGNEAYVTSSKNENGDIFLISNNEDPNSSKRVIYIIKSDYTYDIKTITLSSNTIHNKYPLMAIIKIEDNNKEYIATFSHEGSQFELISYNSERMFTSSLSIVNSGNSFISKNAFMSLKFYDNKNYILSVFVDKSNSNFVAHKLFYQRPDISMHHIENEEKALFQAFTNSSVTCFENEDYVECMYINEESFYTVSIFDISSLNLILTQKIEENIIEFGELFNKCIHFKNNIGAFMYFYSRNSFPRMQLKILDIIGNDYKLSNYTYSIDINSKSVFPLNYHYIYNDIIKTTDNNIFFISTQKSGIEIYIILFKFINGDNNIIINYYRAKINEVNNTAVYKDISVFSFKGLLGLGMSNYDYKSGLNITTYSSFFIIGYLSSENNDNNIHISNDINIFNEENNYEIKINDIINNVKISNNIFYYLIAGIKITSDLNESNLGFYIYSNKTENKVDQNELITVNDVIKFKVSDFGVKLGNYSIEYEIIIKEPEYDDFVSEIVEYYPTLFEGLDINLKQFFKPDYFSTRKSFIYFSINECYKTCESCRYYGNDLNHHCDTCSENFPLYLSIINGKNCFEECPENYIAANNNICKNKSTDLITEHIAEKTMEQIANDISDKSTELISEIKSEGNSEEKIENISEQKTELIQEYITEQVSERIIEYKTELITEKYSGKTQEIDENYNPFIEEIIRNNKCKKLFYVDEKFKINCIDGDFCIEKYPFLDKTIKNMCTNCLVKYKNKCYMKCPENTCIKQDNNLNQCIDIGDDIKVLNEICFDNFHNVTSNIKELSDNNIIIRQSPNITAYVYDIEKDINYFVENKLTYIYFNDIKEILKKEYNLDENSKIYAFIVDSPTKYSNSSINDYAFALFLENGTELNLSNLNDNIVLNLSLPISNLDLANFNYALIFSEQGYDIYNKNSKFYHDICTPGYIKDDDITLAERKQEVFPNNVSILKSNCEYHSTNLNNKRFNFNCSLGGINKNSTNNNIEYHFEEEKNENFFNYLLDMINYKVLNCSILFFNIDNYRHNKAVMICTTSIFLTILLLIIFFCNSMPKIRIAMYNDIPTDKKIRELFFDQIEKNLIFNRSRISNPIKNGKTNIFKKRDKKKKKISRIEKSKVSFNHMDSKYRLVSKSSYINSLDHKEPTVKFMKKVIQSKKRIEQSIEYDDLPLNMAINLDRRTAFYIFKLKLTEKIEITDICMNKKIKDIVLSQYFIYLLVDLTMNAILYSDQIVAHKRHNNGQLDYIIILFLSAFSNIFACIIDYYLEMLIGFEEKINAIKDIKKEIPFLRVSKIMLREITIRVIIFFLIENVIIFSCTYYLFIFFTIYHKSQMSLLKNYIISLLEGWLINIFIALLIVIFRKLGIYFKNKYIYNISKYIDKNF